VIGAVLGLMVGCLIVLAVITASDHKYFRRNKKETQ